MALRLGYLKVWLRAIGNAILNVRMQTMGKIPRIKSSSRFDVRLLDERVGLSPSMKT
jgi:hypothetical protein